MKNSKIYKKFLSMLTAGVIFATPVAANASSKENKESNTTSFALRVQKVEYAPMDINGYSMGVKNAMEYLNKIEYKDLQLDLQCLYYLVNREYMTKEVEEMIIEAGIVYSTDVVNCKFENFVRAYNLINVINDYNQSVVRQPGAMINPSILCFNENDKELVNEMFKNYFNAYQESINADDEKKLPLIENSDYQMVFKQLTTLNGYERAGNASELSVGARFLALNVVGGEVMQMLRDYMQNNYSRAELDKYFVKEELNKGQWILRKDISLDLNCLKNELEVLVFQFGQLWTFVYDHVNDDIMKTFAVECEKTK